MVDARIKGRLATLAMGGQADAAYTPLYARAVHAPRPWGVTMLLAEHTGQTYEKVAIDTERDFWMTAEEAKEYGLVDGILTRRELAAVAAGA